MRRSGAEEAEPPPLGAPRPAYGPRQAGRADRTQGRRRRGVRGAGGGPRRLGGHAGNRRARVATPVARAACLALGWQGGRGSGTARQAERRRTLGVGREPPVGLSTCVPRPWAGRQARAAWGQPHPAWPLVLEPPGGDVL